MRQHDRAADLLVGMARIDAQTDGDLDRLVELALGGLLRERHRLGRVVELGAVEQLGAVLIFLTVFHVVQSSLWS